MAAKQTARRKPVRRSKAKQSKNGQRAIEGASIGRPTSSWLISGVSGDAEVRDHLPLLRSRCRDLERNNDYARGFFEDHEANTLGSEGVILQMKVTEEADRVIHDQDEKAFIEWHQEKTNADRKKVRDALMRRGIGREIVEANWPDVRLLHRNGNRAAKVLKGQPDVFANDLIEKAKKRFWLKQNFTVTREINGQEGERMWLRSTSRDGACLVRKVKGFDNDFRFSLQFIDIDWLDINYNCVLENGNEVRMGKEYNQWKECVAYHVIVRQPGDWLWQTGLTGSYSRGTVARGGRQRIAADEIIHGYVRERIDQAREIPWMISVITGLRMMGKWLEAELMASLLAARKTGTWYSDLFESGMETEFARAADGEFEQATEPGQDVIAPFGWKYQLNDPKHPNTNTEMFRKVMLQGFAAAMPGASYHRVSQDPSGLSFSNLRGIEMQSRESWMMVQSFMRSNFHIPVFEPMLEAALMSGIVPLPVSKFDKYNRPYFMFRKWKGVDPIKEADGNKLNLLLAALTRTRMCADGGSDFEENVLQLVLEEDLLRSVGLDALLLENLGGAKKEAAPTPVDPEEVPVAGTTAPAAAEE
jgi:lambda family phage portal protein